MRFLNKLMGLALILTGIYFLGQNIIFTTHTSRYWWRDIPAGGSVICILGGILILLLAGREARDTGWILVGLGIVLVFLSGGVLLQPTSLWTFFLSFFSMIGGYKLLTRGRLDF
ncbi:hypothetical protein Cri9333_3904 [Crinalium epipsammum PCC 9333]|uniref:Uncharacterized protein n=1 Tax=Crinalium epipsammum PCC 9333 TaxID=1173022 RepID=K9W2X1_9CYAN|nr:hypothetical protein [Crinalium epipsammum]AFZ14713.1 hypothetical protein Cri9333_3904 [Crinalium epipsammum PCC 9333]